MKSYIQGIDIKVLELLNAKFQYRLLERIMLVATRLGNGGLVWIIASMFLIFNEVYKVQGYMMLTSLTITTIMGEGIIKNVIKRARPFVNIIESKILIKKPITYSFPSGHTASSFASAGILLAMNNRWAILALLFASLIGFSRIYLKVHYPTDVIMGVILGILCSKLVVALFQWKEMNYLLINIINNLTMT